MDKELVLHLWRLANIFQPGITPTQFMHQMSNAMERVNSIYASKTGVAAPLLLTMKKEEHHDN